MRPSSSINPVHSYVKDTGSHKIQVELFRRKTADCEERVLIGEAEIPAGYLLHTTESHLIVECLRGAGEIAATVLLKIERFDSKGRSLSIRSSPAGSRPASFASSTASGALQLPRAPSSQLIESSDSASTKDTIPAELITVV